MRKSIHPTGAKPEFAVAQDKGVTLSACLAAVGTEFQSLVTRN